MCFDNINMHENCLTPPNLISISILYNHALSNSWKLYLVEPCVNSFFFLAIVSFAQDKLIKYMVYFY